MGFRTLLILVLVAWVATVVWRRLKRAGRAPRGGGPPERMVRCEQCGVYLPRGEAVDRGEERYVCASHSRPRA